ncbi:MAG: histidine kinase [Oscillibacter sp.]|nr:histidine kinase [Oscillibacter sp.]
MFEVNSIFQVAMELSCAVACFIAAVLTLLGRKTLTKSGTAIARMFCTHCLLLLCDAAAHGFRGKLTPLAFAAVAVSNYLVFVLQYLLLFFSTLYIYALLDELHVQVSRVFLILQGVFCSAGILLVSLSQFTGFVYIIDEQNLYHRAAGLTCTLTLAGMGLLTCAAFVLVYWKSFSTNQLTVLLIFCLAPVISVILEYLIYGISFINISTTLVMLSMFVIHEGNRIQRLEQQALLLAQQQELLTEQRIQLITSQIHPHFLYNALATIGSLCQIDPATAELAVNRFADYLRMNLDALKDVNLIPFSKELEHTQTYLWLEQLRFGDILQVKYDITYQDFQIPPLVLQPIVENAVKHGLFPREEGGTVTISTRKTESGVEIVVADDGVGFDHIHPNLDPKRSHIGVTNVRSRLDALCGGTMTIESVLNEGTTITIFIPDGGTSHEHPAG